MSSTETEKPKISELLAFNNQIIAIKPLIKKTKAFIVLKLKRQINRLKQKKGNEAQLEKNKRKVGRLLEEIASIKKLKFNDIAIFTFENDCTFENYIKTKKQIDLNEISLARIALSKQIINAINKIKTSENDWKSLIIKYKSRIEKKRNWKERQKLYKDIESKLTTIDNEINANNTEKKDNNTKNGENDDSKLVNNVKTEINKEEKVKKKKIEKVNEKKEEEKKEDVHSDSEDNEINDDSDTADEDKESVDDEDDDDDDEDEDQGEEDVDENKNETKNNETIINSSIENNKQTNTNKPKLYLNNKNEPKGMVIKTINLDNLKDVDEIELADDEERTSEDKEDIVEPLQKESSNSKTKRKIDPFFLNENGEEQEAEESDRVDRVNRHNHSMDSDYNNRSSYNNYGDNKRRKGDYMKSSFTSSLSSNKRSFDNNDRYDNRKSSFRNDNRSNNYNRFDNDRNRNNNYDKQSFNNSNPHKYPVNEKRNDFSKNEKPKDPPMDSANLHPSWKAKKEMEEKLKNLKFQGTKLKFDKD